MVCSHHVPIQWWGKPKKGTLALVSIWHISSVPHMHLLRAHKGTSMIKHQILMIYGWIEGLITWILNGLFCVWITRDKVIIQWQYTVFPFFLKMPKTHLCPYSGQSSHMYIIHPPILCVHRLAVCSWPSVIAWPDHVSNWRLASWRPSHVCYYNLSHIPDVYEADVPNSHRGLSWRKYDSGCLTIRRVVFYTLLRRPEGIKRW